MVEDKYIDVLANLETNIVKKYKENSEITDYDVIRVVEIVIEIFNAEKAGRQPRSYSLSERESCIFDCVYAISGWSLGRAKLEEKRDVNPNIKTVDEVVYCLKKIKKSAEKHSQSRGKHGYLDFITNFFGQI
ncbi:MAG: hypothetical protein A2452_12345 [Candidatus Firestonebacteria bacterium RIFOXYC2_FULL_39_67]|nr:MAG: hypothetical protein A2536_07875 [Candidatus Firestonebacteria bacterium RIFOXYD2_FULL_39_29]OGF55637.1 MAG: hypothetical protein A2452_12345 [Candidatus Firestonebacteria bacterium RIFOXYC2_FULL_39_67]OGF57560.1 MAG: hypothetical protein A2497_01305 [Candidatus Firestonebacteria bacterium RifOxyC12_full_39_7]